MIDLDTTNCSYTKFILPGTEAKAGALAAHNKANELCRSRLHWGLQCTSVMAQVVRIAVARSWVVSSDWEITVPLANKPLPKALFSEDALAEGPLAEKSLALCT